MSNKNKPADQKNLLEGGKFYTLSACAYRAIHDIKGGDEYFENFLQWAMDGLQQFHFDVIRSIQAGEFDMKTFKQLDYPGRAIDITMIGFRYGDMIKTFTIDTNIPRVWDKNETETLENMPAVPLSQASVSDLYLPFFGSNEQGMVGPKYYGNACRHNGVGYYDNDRDNRVINLKETIPNQTKVYLEWITDGINYDGETLIHPYIFLAVKDYIHWQRREHDPKVGLGEKDRAMKLWEKSFDKAQMRYLDLSIDDIREALMISRRQAPRI